MIFILVDFLTSDSDGFGDSAGLGWAGWVPQFWAGPASSAVSSIYLPGFAPISSYAYYPSAGERPFGGWALGMGLGLGAGPASSSVFSPNWSPFPASSSTAWTRPSHASSSAIPMLAVTPSPTKAAGSSVNQSQAPVVTSVQATRHGSSSK